MPRYTFIRLETICKDRGGSLAGNFFICNLQNIITGQSLFELTFGLSTNYNFKSYFLLKLKHHNVTTRIVSYKFIQSFAVSFQEWIVIYLECVILCIWSVFQSKNLRKTNWFKIWKYDYKMAVNPNVHMVKTGNFKYRILMIR